MPRSVNSVASRARRKKILNKPKDTLVEEKMFGQLQRMLLRKHCYTHIEIERQRKEILNLCGL